MKLGTDGPLVEASFEPNRNYESPRKIHQMNTTPKESSSPQKSFAEVAEGHRLGWGWLKLEQLKPHPRQRDINGVFRDKVTQIISGAKEYRQNNPVHALLSSNPSPELLEELRKSRQASPVSSIKFEGLDLTLIDGQHRISGASDYLKLLAEKSGDTSLAQEPWMDTYLVVVYSKEFGLDEDVLVAWMVHQNVYSLHLESTLGEQMIAYARLGSKGTIIASQIFQDETFGMVIKCLEGSDIWRDLLSLMRIKVFGNGFSKTTLERWLTYSQLFGFLKFILRDTLIQHISIQQRAQKATACIEEKDWFGSTPLTSKYRKSGTREFITYLLEKNRLDLSRFGFNETQSMKFFEVSISRRDIAYGCRKKYLFKDRIVLPDDLIPPRKHAEIKGPNSSRDIIDLLEKCQAAASVLAVILFAGDFPDMIKRRPRSAVSPTWQARFQAKVVEINKITAQDEQEKVLELLDTFMAYIVSEIDTFTLPPTYKGNSLPHHLVVDSKVDPPALKKGSWAHDALDDMNNVEFFRSLVGWFQHAFNIRPQDAIWIYKTVLPSSDPPSPLPSSDDRMEVEKQFPQLSIDTSQLTDRIDDPSLPMTINPAVLSINPRSIPTLPNDTTPPGTQSPAHTEPTRGSGAPQKKGTPRKSPEPARMEPSRSSQVPQKGRNSQKRGRDGDGDGDEYSVEKRRRKSNKGKISVKENGGRKYKSPDRERGSKNISKIISGNGNTRVDDVETNEEPLLSRETSRLVEAIDFVATQGDKEQIEKCRQRIEEFFQEIMEICL